MSECVERDDVPVSFRKGKRPEVNTVGELMDELRELPEDLELMEGSVVTVTKLNGAWLRVCIEEYDEDWNEEDD